MSFVIEKVFKWEQISLAGLRKSGYKAAENSH